jgi:hypothetical protein
MSLLLVVMGRSLSGERATAMRDVMKREGRIVYLTTLSHKPFALKLRPGHQWCDYIPIRIRIPAISASAAVSAGGNGRAIIPANPSRISQIANSSIPALRVMRTAIVHLREGML